MPKYLFRKPETPNLQNPQIQRLFIEEIRSPNELIQKELELNLVEQNLLSQRIRMMRSFANDLPASDPQYSMLLTQIQMDEIELSELRSRERSLIEKKKKSFTVKLRGKAMAKRRDAKKKTKKTSARKTPKKKYAISTTDSPRAALLKNRKAHWAVYQDLQKRADHAWNKLKADVMHKASPDIIMQDRKNLFLLLGEVNYMAGECMRMAKVPAR